MDDWVQFLSAFPQPGGIHTWLLNQGNYIGLHALFALQQQEKERGHHKRPSVAKWRDDDHIPTPFHVHRSAQNPVLHGLITLPGHQGPNFVLGFGPTPKLVLQESKTATCLVRGCQAVGLVAQPAVPGICVRIFHHRRLWFLAHGSYVGHHRQPFASFPTRLQMVLTKLNGVLAKRSSSAITRGHGSMLWQECRRCLDPQRAYYFRLTEDDLYFIGSYPVLWPCCIGRLDPTLPENQPNSPDLAHLFEKALPVARVGHEADMMSCMSYGAYHTGTFVYNPVTLAAVIVTTYHNNFLLHRLIKKKESPSTLIARLVFLTRVLRPLRPDLGDAQTQVWIRDTLVPFLEQDVQRMFPDMHARITGLVDNLFTHTIPTWIADIESGGSSIPAAWVHPLMAIISRPKWKQWLPLWEGAFWVRLIATAVE